MWPKNKLTQEEIDKINRLYVIHGQVKKVAIETGYDQRTVTKYLVNNNSKRKQYDPNKVIQAYRINGTLIGTAKIFNLSQTTIFRILRKNNITVGNGSKDSIRLYNTLRARATKSSWRQRILERDNFQCVECGVPSRIVHHIKKLSEIRDEVFKENPDLDPFGSYQELRSFSDLFLNKHNIDEGVILCRGCHEAHHR